MLTVATVAGRLREAGCVAAEEEAGQLAGAAPDAETLEAWVRRREQGEPLAWITGTIDFCGRRLRIAPGVYVPRLQTEELARRAAGLLRSAAAGGGRGSGRAVDLCTGAGAIAAYLRAAVPAATVVGVDIDPAAVACARSNGVPTLVGDLGSPLRTRAFDVVTAVAPYVPTGHIQFLPVDVQRYEPRHAIDGGHDGLDVVRKIVASAACVLRPGGWLLVELGGDQDAVLRPALDASGFAGATPWFDEDGDLRGAYCYLDM